MQIIIYILSIYVKWYLADILVLCRSMKLTPLLIKSDLLDIQME
jgi:hypothetical protein